MLKRLGKWLDSLTDFAMEHPNFAVGVPAAIVVIVFYAALCFTITGADRTPEVKWEGDIVLEDTRRVHCIRFGDGGVSCDWSRADGSDNL